MKTQVLAAVAAVCISAVAANGQGQVVSHHFNGNVDDAGVSLGFTTPAEGFVLTDIVVAAWDNTAIWISKADGDPTNWLIGWNPDDSQRQLHLRSGISIDGDITLYARKSGNDFGTTVSFTGYIPSPTTSGIIPAVSSWGMLTLAIGVAAAGTVALRRKRQVA